MASAIVTSKGQITIPIEVRTALGLSAGTRVEFVTDEQGRCSMVPKTLSITALKGILRKPEKPVTLEMMEEAIAAEATKGFR